MKVRSVFNLRILLIAGAVFYGLASGSAFAEEAVGGQAPAPKNIASDSNKDGKPDHWQLYDQNGQVAKVEVDTNFDGKVDQWAFYENGKIKKAEKDSDYDGKPDQWVDY